MLRMPVHHGLLLFYLAGSLNRRQKMVKIRGFHSYRGRIIIAGGFLLVLASLTMSYIPGFLPLKVFLLTLNVLFLFILYKGFHSNLEG